MLWVTATAGKIVDHEVVELEPRLFDQMTSLAPSVCQLAAMVVAYELLDSVQEEGTLKTRQPAHVGHALD